MSKRPAEPGMAQAHVELCRAQLRDAIRRPVRRVGEGAPPLPRAQVEYLRREAEDLYWTELIWEELTDEEAVAGGHLTELVFPAFLAFIDGLLPPQSASSYTQPHPDVVEAILVFLGERFASLSAELEGGADSMRCVVARAMTAGLLDLVLYRLYGLTVAEREMIEALG